MLKSRKINRMKQIYIKSARKILQNKESLERELNIKINVRGTITIISGKEIDEYIAEKVLEALDFGFELDDALLLKEEDYMFERFCIKDFTRSHNLHEVRGRIIGTKGKTLEVLKELSNCAIILNDNDIGIIGKTEDILIATQALKSLVRGSRHGNVYAYLEKHKGRKRKIRREL